MKFHLHNNLQNNTSTQPIAHYEWLGEGVELDKLSKNYYYRHPTTVQTLRSITLYPSFKKIKTLETYKVGDFVTTHENYYARIECLYQTGSEAKCILRFVTFPSFSLSFFLEKIQTNFLLTKNPGGVIKNRNYQTNLKIWFN